MLKVDAYISPHMYGHLSCVQLIHSTDEANKPDTDFASVGLMVSTSYIENEERNIK